MGELKDHVISRLGGPPPDLAAFEDDLEQWMSHLASDQPWLLDQENLENRALFLRVAQLVYESVSEQERLARESCGEKPPAWLVKLVERWADNSASIITFNYDLLVERVLRSLRRVQTFADLYPVPLSSRMSAGSTPFLSDGGPNGPVPRILKLHGSLNWRFGGITAPPSDELYLAEGNDFWEASASYTYSSLPRDEARFDHKIPVIVPPTGIKSGWYSNLALRGLWRRAAAEIGKCTRLVVVGYSLPPTDLLVRQLIASHLPKTSGVEVVNLTSDPATALEKLLQRPIEYNYSGTGAIENFSANYVA
jgi:hypothetical protein